MNQRGDAGPNSMQASMEQPQHDNGRMGGMNGGNGQRSGSNFGAQKSGGNPRRQLGPLERSVIENLNVNNGPLTQLGHSQKAMGDGLNNEQNAYGLQASQTPQLTSNKAMRMDNQFGAEQDGMAAMDYMSNQNAKTLNPIARKNQQFTRNQLNM